VAIAKAPQAVQRGPRTRVPAIEEVALREELDERRAELERSRERLASVESELRIARAEIARLEGRR
jgi:dynactin complex subunit